ncbi:hypothetical protein GCK32_016475 [Trichostrongylus colubriformis]|uniref:Major facilitator superfamily (MFS) profile domain-containing protein n=1 Tax=Trichostrongylus colubriformis TaxID=6319 RepID=A0AAN8IR38_TRICO
MAFYYYGLSFLSVDLSDDRFTAYMLSAFVELPGGLMVLPLMLYAGRQTLCLFSMVLQGICVIVAPLLKHSHWSMVGLFLLGKFINSVTYAVHPIYISEMTPTSVRSLSFSIINIPQSIGIIVAPYLRHVTFGPEYVKFIVVGVLCIIAGLLCLLLPETKDRPMPPDIRSLTASDDRTVDMRDREELMREQELDDDEGPSSENAPILRKEE